MAGSTESSIVNTTSISSVIPTPVVSESVPDAVDVPASSAQDFTVYHTNQNDPSTPIGALCWTVWEIFRQQVLLFEDPDKISKTMIQTISQDVFVELNKHLQRDDILFTDLPKSLEPFVNAFFASFNERLEGRSIDKPIVIDNLEGADAFEEAISQSPECVVP